MQGVTICYDFRFNLEVRKKDGRVYKRHMVNGLGLDFSSALWDVYFKVKKRKTVILKITSVTPLRIAFAFKGNESLSFKLSDCPPTIPQDLETALKHLPQ